MAGKKRTVGKWASVHKLKKTNGPRTVRSLIRQHLRVQELAMGDTLTKAWGVKSKAAVYMKMYRGEAEPLYPHQIAAFCEELKLGPEERHEMMVLGAREWGFEIDDPFAKKELPPILIEVQQLSREIDASTTKLRELTERMAQGRKTA